MNRLSTARLWAMGLGVLVAVVSWALAPGFLDGRVWQPLAEAACLRAPEHLMPGLWRLLAYGCVRTMGLDRTIVLLMIGGPLALGYLTYRAASSIHTVLALTLQTDRCPPIFQKMLIPGLVAAGVGYFVSAWPIFPTASTLTPQALSWVLLFTVFGLARRFLLGSSRVCGSLGMFLTGILAAEGLWGWIVLLLFLASCLIRMHADVYNQFVLSNRAARNVAKWIATVCFLLGFGLSLGLNLWFFLHHGGSWSTAFLNFRTSIGGSDWAVIFGLVIAPCLLTAVMLPQATNTETYLSYARGMILMVCGVTAVAFLMQPGLVTFQNETLIVLLRYLSTFTVVGVLTAVVVEVYCRNHLSVLVFRYGGDPDVPVGRTDLRFPEFVRRYLYVGLVGGLVLLSVGMVWWEGARLLAREIDQCATWILEEAKGLEWIFSDGSIDELLELKAARTGARISCVSLFTKRDAHAVSVRQRWIKGEEDLRSMALGGAVALGTWIETNSPELAKSAVQLGFEYWRRRADRSLPSLGGFLARPGGYPTETHQSEARKRAEAFAVRVDSPEVVRAYDRCHDRRLKERFDALKWRVARIFELRARQADRQGNVEEGTRLISFARKLDDRNASLAEMRTFLGLLWEQSELQITPREGLAIALKHANFRAAQSHARAVLASNPEDADANFALGMYNYLSRDYKRADEYLQRALEARPKEPALLNNLAIVRMRLGRLVEALELSDRALAVKPDRDELQQTNEEIRRRLAEAEKSQSQRGTR